MAAIKNLKDFEVYSEVLGRIVHAFEVVKGLPEELAERAAQTGIFKVIEEVIDDIEGHDHEAPASEYKVPASDLTDPLQGAPRSPVEPINDSPVIIQEPPLVNIPDSHAVSPGEAPVVPGQLQAEIPGSTPIMVHNPDVPDTSGDRTTPADPLISSDSDTPDVEVREGHADDDHDDVPGDIPDTTGDQSTPADPLISSDSDETEPAPGLRGFSTSGPEAEDTHD